MNMKKIGMTVLIAMVGGLLAIGGYKLFENKQVENMSIEEKQEVYFANNPLKINSSTGNPDFTQASAAVSPAVVHIITTYEAKSRQLMHSSPLCDQFEAFIGSQ